MSQQGRILGIGGIFFKSANKQQMQEWYAKHLGLADSGHGVMLPWREKDNPESEQMTVWSVFPANTKYFEPSSASFMVNYIVDNLDALLERLAKEGVRIDPKRQDESYEATRRKLRPLCLGLRSRRQQNRIVAAAKCIVVSPPPHSSTTAGTN